MFERLSGKKGAKSKEEPSYEVVRTTSAHHEHGEGLDEVKEHLVLTSAGQKRAEKAEEEREGRKISALQRKREGILTRMTKIINAQREESGGTSRTAEFIPAEFADLSTDEISDLLIATSTQLNQLRAREKSKWGAFFTRTLLRQKHPDEARLTKKIEQLNKVSVLATNNDIVSLDTNRKGELRDEYRNLQAELEEIEHKMGLS